jgi:hypothetical protein
VIRRSPTLTAVVLLLTSAAVAAAPAKRLFTDEELAQGSRQALLATGLSEPFVEAHFKQGKVVQAGTPRTYKVMGPSGLLSRRSGKAWVEWTLDWDGWTARLRDEIIYVVQDSYPPQVQVQHGLKTALGTARDLQHTLPKATVRNLLKDCLGPYSEETVVYRSFGPSAEARLFLKAKNSAGAIGAVDLESGECHLQPTVGEQARLP